MGLAWTGIPSEAKPATFFTSMFLHGNVGHLLGNMVFLFLFAFALEVVLGRVAFAAVYLVGGVLPRSDACAPFTQAEATRL